MGVFAPARPAPFVFAEQAKIHLNPVRQALIKPSERLTFRIVKERTALSIARHERAMLKTVLRATDSHSTGGAGRDRTDDLLLAKQALSQLSYSPEADGGSGWIRTIDPRLIKTVL